MQEDGNILLGWCAVAGTRPSILVLESADWSISSRSKLVSPISYFGNTDDSRGGAYQIYIACLPVSKYSVPYIQVMESVRLHLPKCSSSLASGSQISRLL